jgi:uncharacterized protein (UPF0276 family)
MLSVPCEPPRVGIGLDYKYRDNYAKPLHEICRDWSARLSHLSVVSLQNQREAADFRALAGSLPVVHHLSNIAPANPGGPDLELLDRQDEMSRVLGAAWCGEDIGIWSLGPYQIPYFAPPVLDESSVRFIARGVREVARRCSVPFLAEIPSFSFVAGDLSLGDFFTRLVADAGCSLVLDLSHVFSYALAKGTNAARVLESLPLDAVREIHIAGGKVSTTHATRYIDNHSDPVLEPVLELLRIAARICENLRAVTYEIGVSIRIETMEAELVKIQHILEQERFVPSW